MIESTISPGSPEILPQSIPQPEAAPSNLYVPRRPPSDPKDDEPVVVDNSQKVFKETSFVVLLLAGFYVVKTFAGLMTLVILDRTTSSAGIVFSFLRQFPVLGIMPVLYCLFAIYLAYLGVKLHSGSRQHHRLAMFSLALIPVGLIFVNIFLLKPVAELNSRLSDQDSGPFAEVIDDAKFNLFDPQIMVSIVVLAALIYFYKKFVNEAAPLGKKSKLILAGFIFIAVLPTVFILGLSSYNALDTNYGYTNAVKTAGFHVYKPVHEPEGLAYATKFTSGNELAEKNNSVHVAFDIPFDKLLTGEETQPIVIRQVEVEPNFDLKNYADTSMPNAIPESYPISNAKNQTGYVLQKSLGNSNLSSLVFLTEDNILIEIVSTKAALERLVQVAESLQ